jgi:cyclic beta-1,2-glucan synthetase
MLDAILRSLAAWRVGRHLLEWVTAAQTGSRAARPICSNICDGGLGPWSWGLRVGLCLVPKVWPLLLPFALVWLAAPALARMISLPRAALTPSALSHADRQACD